MTSNIDIDEGIIAKIDEKLFSVIEKDESIMETDEYKRLFAMAKKVYPYENDYFIHIACISYFKEVNADKIM